MRTIRFLSATLLLLVACSCQDIAFLQDLIPGLGDGREQEDVTDELGDDDQTEEVVPATETSTPLPQADLRYGDNVGETLTSGRGDLWTFSAEAGDVVTITMTSGEFDTFLALFDPGGDYLTCDDDSAGEYNASIHDFPMNTSGIYTINAMGLTPDSMGSYSLSISNTPNGLAHTRIGGGSLNIGDMKSGSLERWTGDAWTFDGSAGDVVSVGARSDDFDTVLSIYGPDLYREAWDDDGLGGLNSLISGLTLPTGGRYAIVVRSFSDSSIGAYELGTAAGTEIPGYTVSISVASEEFDTFVALFSPGAYYLTCDDDGGGGLNSLINGYSLTESGLYSIVVFSYGISPTGSYTLTLDQTTPDGAAFSINSDLILYGSPVDQTLGAWVGDEWIFQGDMGDEITISMTSEDFVTALDLYGIDLLRDMSDIGSGGDGNSLMTVTLPASGIYTLVARAFAPDGAGSYTLSITN
jgi:hypothetical protein